MKHSNPVFVRERIRSRAKKHKLPYPNTGFWDGAPSALKQSLPSGFTEPVVFSMSQAGGATVIGVDEICAISERGTERLKIHQLRDVTSPCIQEHKPKAEFDAVEVVTLNKTYRLPTEKGSGCFAIWNIILMLTRMNEIGEPPAGGNAE